MPGAIAEAVPQVNLARVMAALPPAQERWNVGYAALDAAGRVVDSGSGHNILCDDVRAKLASALALAIIVTPEATASQINFFGWGTGTGVPSAQMTALQFPLTAKQTGAATGLGTSAFTARVYCTLGGAEVSGNVLREMAIGRSVVNRNGSSALNGMFARWVINGGTGITASGATILFWWDVACTTGTT